MSPQPPITSSAARKKILMVYPAKSSFVVRDIDILSQAYTVEGREVSFRKKWKTPLQLMGEWLWMMLNMRRYSLVICQGASFHSWMPALAGRLKKTPVAIVAIGTDCCSYPEINYGNFRKKFLGKATGVSFLKATVIFPVHKSLGENTNTYFNQSRQGIRTFVPQLGDTLRPINNGFSPDTWKLLPDVQRLPWSFITVSASINKTTLVLKGLDLFLEMAKRFPQYKFTIVGKMEMELSLPPNVEQIPFLNQAGLVEQYNRHSFYCQLSVSEGFPNAITEAMMCGCVPIGSHVTAIPEIIGDTGFLLTKRDADQLSALLSAIDAGQIDRMGQAARERVIRLFSWEEREQKLLSAVEMVIAQKK